MSTLFTALQPAWKVPDDPPDTETAGTYWNYVRMELSARCFLSCPEFLCEAVGRDACADGDGMSKLLTNYTQVTHIA